MNTIKDAIRSAISGLMVGGLVGLLGMGLVAQTGGIADEETPSGAIDGVNDTFRIARAPSPFLSLHVYRNGLRLKRCRAGINLPCDYTLVTPYNKFVFIPSQVPQPGDILIADYRY